MDFHKLPELLENWQTENCDPVWMVRKAAILFQTARVDDAAQLTTRALVAIRQIRDDRDSVSRSSREGWALWLEWELQWRHRDKSRQEELPSDGSLRRRWRELSSLHCNTLIERDEYINAMKPRNDAVGVLPFDLGTTVRPGLKFSKQNYHRWIAARRAIRLVEVAPLPSIRSEMLNHITAVLLETEPSELELAIRLVLVSCTRDEDKILQRVLSRCRVATLPVDSVRTLTGICEGVIDYALPRMAAAGEHHVFWIERMRVAMEVLSRLILRLQPNNAETLFDKALNLYPNRKIAEESLLAQPFQNLLERSWEALPAERRHARVLDLLSAPIVGVDGFKAKAAQYPEPGSWLNNELLTPTRTLTRTPQRCSPLAENPWLIATRATSRRPNAQTSIT